MSDFSWAAYSRELGVISDANKDALAIVLADDATAPVPDKPMATTSPLPKPKPQAATTTAASGVVPIAKPPPMVPITEADDDDTAPSVATTTTTTTTTGTVTDNDRKYAAALFARSDWPIDLYKNSLVKMTQNRLKEVFAQAVRSGNIENVAAVLLAARPNAQHQTRAITTIWLFLTDVADELGRAPIAFKNEVEELYNLYVNRTPIGKWPAKYDIVQAVIAFDEVWAAKRAAQEKQEERKGKEKKEKEKEKKTTAKHEHKKHKHKKHEHHGKKRERVEAPPPTPTTTFAPPVSPPAKSPPRKLTKVDEEVPLTTTTTTTSTTATTTDVSLDADLSYRTPEEWAKRIYSALPDTMFPGEGATTDPLYGEISASGMYKIFAEWHKATGFGRMDGKLSQSTFLDIGSGRGLTVFLAAFGFGCRRAWGIEVSEVRAKMSKGMLTVLNNKEGHKLPIGRVQLQLADVTKVANFDGISHVYMFDIGWPLPLHADIAKKFNNTASCEYIISYASLSELQDAGFAIEQMNTMQVAHPGSGRKHTAYFYRKVHGTRSSSSSSSSSSSLSSTSSSTVASTMTTTATAATTSATAPTTTAVTPTVVNMPMVRSKRRIEPVQIGPATSATTTAPMTTTATTATTTTTAPAATTTTTTAKAKATTATADTDADLVKKITKEAYQDKLRLPVIRLQILEQAAKIGVKLTNDELDAEVKVADSSKAVDSRILEHEIDAHLIHLKRGLRQLWLMEAALSDSPLRVLERLRDEDAPPRAEAGLVLKRLLELAEPNYNMIAALLIGDAQSGREELLFRGLPSILDAIDDPSPHGRRLRRLYDHYIHRDPLYLWERRYPIFRIYKAADRFAFYTHPTPDLLERIRSWRRRQPTMAKIDFLSDEWYARHNEWAELCRKILNRRPYAKTAEYLELFRLTVRRPQEFEFTLTPLEFLQLVLLNPRMGDTIKPTLDDDRAQRALYELNEFVLTMPTESMSSVKWAQLAELYDNVEPTYGANWSDYQASLTEDQWPIQRSLYVQALWHLPRAPRGATFDLLEHVPISAVAFERFFSSPSPSSSSSSTTTTTTTTTATATTTLPKTAAQWMAANFHFDQYFHGFYTAAARYGVIPCLIWVVQHMFEATAALRHRRPREVAYEAGMSSFRYVRRLIKKMVPEHITPRQLQQIASAHFGTIHDDGLAHRLSWSRLRPNMVKEWCFSKFLPRIAEAIQTCAFPGCGKTATKTCNGCAYVGYCSNEHHAQHWQSAHRWACHALPSSQTPTTTTVTSQKENADEEAWLRRHDELEAQLAKQAQETLRLAELEFRASLKQRANPPGDDDGDDDADDKDKDKDKGGDDDTVSDKDEEEDDRRKPMATSATYIDDPTSGAISASLLDLIREGAARASLDAIGGGDDDARARSRAGPTPSSSASGVTPMVVDEWDTTTTTTAANINVVPDEKTRERWRNEVDTK